MAAQGNIAVDSSDSPEISRNELRRRLRDSALKIVDVLPVESYTAAHIPGAISIPLELLASRAGQLLPDRNSEIVVYCGNLTCDRSEKAQQILQQLGYTNVRDYQAGIADWVDAGEPTESVAEKELEPEPAAILPRPRLTVSSDGQIGRAPARVLPMRRGEKSMLDLVQQRSALQLFIVWIGMVLLSGTTYWLLALAGQHGLVEAGSPLGVDFKSFTSALYFSFVTATSVGYGDIVPIGIARAIAVAEAVAALLIFGAVIAKFVSHRQDEMMSEIHRVTFEERLDRVQTNLHTVISELLSITAMCEADASLNTIGTRLDSSVIIFLTEMRSIHDLLYQPRLIVEEGVLSSILANLSSALTVLSELLQHLPPAFVRSEPLDVALENLTRLAGEICSNCVPHGYTPRLVFWMDRIQSTAATIK